MTTAIPTATFIATPQQVEAVIAPVLPFASTDQHLPMITVVNLEFAGCRLLAVATNRFALAANEARLDEWDKTNSPVSDAFTVNLFARDLRRILSFTRSHKKDRSVWEVTRDRLTVTTDGETISVRTVAVDFVDWRAVLGSSKVGAGDSITALGAAPRQLDVFLKAAALIPYAGPLIIHPGQSALSPIVIRIGERFTGLLMPVRLPEELRALDLTSLIERPTPAALVAS